MNVPLTIQSMRVLTPIMIKRLMQKNTAELTEMEKANQIVGTFFFDRAFESSRKKLMELKHEEKI
jgi:hypothetical protein